MPPPGETEQQVIPWNDTVRNSGVVRVFVGSGMRASRWVGIIDKAVATLNQELANKGLKIEIRRTAEEADAEATLDTVPGSGLHGQSFLDVGGSGQLRKVTIKVPDRPLISQRDPHAREVGQGVRLYMLAHELLHTLGLTNAAHSKDDVFTRQPVLLQQGVVINGTGLTEDKVQSYDASVAMPPIRLGASTIANLKKAWP